MNNKFLEKLSYWWSDKEDRPLYHQMNKFAEACNGKLSEQKEDEEGRGELTWEFKSDHEANLFKEIKGIILSREEGFLIDEPETQLDTRMFPDGFYHHATYETEEKAFDAAASLRSVLRNHFGSDAFDISLVEIKQDKNKSEFLVVFGFPIESIICMPDDFEKIFEKELENDPFLLINKKVDNSKLN